MVKRDKCEYCGEGMKQRNGQQKYHKRCVKEAYRKYQRGYMREYRKQPHVMEMQRGYGRDYYHNNKEKMKKYHKEYSKTYLKKPEVIRKRKESAKKYHALRLGRWKSLNDAQQLYLMQQKTNELMGELNRK